MPDVVVDAMMAKRNTGTRKTEAPLVIGVGPDFRAPDECMRLSKAIEATTWEG